MKEKLQISYSLDENTHRNFELSLIESKDYDHFTIWETRESPIFRITQEDYHYFKSGKDIELISGYLEENDKEIIAFLFNEQIDELLNRPVKLHIIITREEDDLPFEYGLIQISTYYESDSGFKKNKTFAQVMNNINGYVQVEYVVDPELNDRFLKVESIEIGYKIPSGIHAEQKSFSDDVIYADHKNNGIVRGISDKTISPRVDVKVSFLSDIFTKGIEMKEDVFLSPNAALYIPARRYIFP